MSTCLKFKDEDDFDFDLENINILFVENGYIIKYSTEEEEWQEVYTDTASLLKKLARCL